MKKLFLIFTTALAMLLAVGCEEQGNDNVGPNDNNSNNPIEQPESNPLIDILCSPNEILYTTKDNLPIELNTRQGFGSDLFGHTYADGVGRLTFKNEVIAIPEKAFHRHTTIKYIKLPDSVTSIGDLAFDGCTSLTNVTIGNGVTEIGWCAFRDCSSLTSITIPDSVTEIGKYAFNGCSSLTSITIPDSVTEIGKYAFNGCTSLTSITIPDSVISIGDSAFSLCSSLTSFYGKFASEDGKCLIVDNVLKAFAIGCNLAEYTIPDGVTSIGPSAFRDCTSLTSVTIGNGVTSIGVQAFSDCSSLTSVYCKPTTPPSADSYMFAYNASGRKIFVPTESVDAYKNASYWSNYADAIEPYVF